MNARAATRDVSIARELAAILAKAYIFALRLDDFVDLDLRSSTDYSGHSCARDLTRHLDLAHHLAHSLPADDLAGELLRTIDLARDLSRQVAYELTREFAHDRNIAHELARDIDSIRYLARDYIRRFPADDARNACAAPAALRLVAVAGLLLPRSDRPRYVEEYRAELFYLADHGAKRWHQVSYSVRQLLRAPQMRAACRRQLEAP
jgi:hypothetical protein